MSIEPYEDNLINLWDLDYMFAVENLEAKYGRIEVQQVHYESKDEVIKTVSPIQMVDCEELLQTTGFNNENFKIEKLR